MQNKMIGIMKGSEDEGERCSHDFDINVQNTCVLLECRLKNLLLEIRFWIMSLQYNMRSVSVHEKKKFILVPTNGGHEKKI